jgi:hypothetical protein
MKCLIFDDRSYDLSAVIESCGVETSYASLDDAINTDLSGFDAYIIYADGKVLDPRFRISLEKEVAAGKKLFTEGLNSWGGIYSGDPVDTTRMRLVVVAEPENGGAEGLHTGDLLDDGSNRMICPWYKVPEFKPILVYQNHIIAHKHWNAPLSDIMKDSLSALWTVGDNVMMCAFLIHNFSRAWFAPQKSWQSLVGFIAHWITGSLSFSIPSSPVRFCKDELADDRVFEECRKKAIENGTEWLRRFLVDDGKGGIREGFKHNISPDGELQFADAVRNDCSGEAAGVFLFYGMLNGKQEYLDYSDNLRDFTFGPMQIKGGKLDGMMRWTHTAWEVCYQDDVSRSILTSLYECFFFDNKKRLPDICRALDFLVRTTAKDGCRVARTDGPDLTDEKITELVNEEHGRRSAHYNAYYHAALLLAYKCCGNEKYFEVAKNGLESIMALYPETGREQSETEELCRLILPLALLYYMSKESKHRDMLYLVTRDLCRLRHPFGGYCEWDTGYKAHYSRESRSECSLLAENGDPVADLLYSNNWLPLGFAFAYLTTGDEMFASLWRGIVEFFIKTQIISDNSDLNGAWCRAFDMESEEIYGCPHDIGWAARCSETGWTDAEILMGMMLPDIVKKTFGDK